MTITGLSNDYYLINNDINIIVDGFATQIKSLDLKMTNNFNTYNATVRLYPINNTFKINISPLVKSLFDIPDFDLSKNMNSVKIEFKALDISNSTEIQNVTKNYIIGGNFKGKQNYLSSFDSINTYLSLKLPVWIGYPAYFTSINLNVFEETFSTLPDFNKEFMEIPCNGKYVRFLNQYGTYSTWFFDNFEETIKTKNNDTVKQFNTDFLGNSFFDIGSTVDKTIELKGLIPARYNNLISNLTFSPEVYILGDFGLWIKMIQNSQEWIDNPTLREFEFSIKFDYESVLNPNVLW